MYLKITILTLTFCFLYVKGIIPNLSVKKLDPKLIERKRKDTLEICRIFNEEIKTKSVTNNTNDIQYKRTKRDLDNNELGNPSLKEDDNVKGHKVSDKLYSDLDTKDNPVDYRQNDTTKIENQTQNIYRRFNFAPSQLYGYMSSVPESTEKALQMGHDIPWIQKWKHGILPFFIDPNTYDSFLAETIIKAFDYIEKATCIRLQRLRERPTDKESMQNVKWLYITNPSGIRQCVHTNERKSNTGVQMVVFGYDCLSQGQIAHEVMHILGFSHEHTRPDRDHHITIMYDNIKPGYKKYFEIRKDYNLYTFPYDYASVLHYPPRAFSKNGQVTIKTRRGMTIGQRNALSQRDMEKIGVIYGYECIDRNDQYLYKTCPIIGKISNDTEDVSTDEIDEYFKDRVWPYGIINYQIKDATEFTAEERQNIKAVINHIEKETCIEFRNTDENEIDNQDYEIEYENENDSESSEHVVDFFVPIDIYNYSNSNYKQQENNNDTLTVENETPNPNKIKLTLTVDNGSSVQELTNEIENNTATTVSVLRQKIKHKTKKHSVRGRSGSKKIKRGGAIKKKRKIRRPVSPHRRHAVNLIVLKRSSEPGCKCPPPGRPNGNKLLTIQSDCFNSVNDLLHIFVHVLGLDHQHNMHDRDKYLHILWNELTQEVENEMREKLPPAASVGFAYDYQSVMHYPWLQIKDGVTNIMYPVWNDGWAMGHWQGLSWTDVQKLNVIYKEQCENRKREMRME